MKSKPIDPMLALDRLIAGSLEPEGNGWFSIHDFMVRYGYSRQYSHIILEKLATEGKLEKWVGTLKKERRRGCKYRVL